MNTSSSSHGASSTGRTHRTFGSRAFRILALTAAVALGAPATLAFADSVHTVSPGETASGIADQYGVPLETIIAYNGIKNQDLILAGSKLTIPAYSGGPGVSRSSAPEAVQYRVQSGDTLSHIAQKFGATVSQIADLNDLHNQDRIFEGQLISVPANPVAGVGSFSKDDARQMLREAAWEFGVAEDLVLAVAWQESGWQQHLVSHAGAIGMMQVIPSTANWAITELGVRNAEDWRTNPRSNARVGAAVLSRLIDQAGGDGSTALAFYVQGWWSIEQFGWFDETKQYVASVNVIRDWYR